MKKLIAHLVLLVLLTGSAFAASSPLTQTVNMGTVARSSSTWSSGTAGNTSVSLPVANMASVSVTINTTSTMTGGAITFELSDDGGTTYFGGGCTRNNAATTEQTYSFIATTLQSWNCPVAGFTHFRARLSTTISGTGQAVVAVSGSAGSNQAGVTASQSNPSALQMTVGNPLPAGANTLGNVQIIDAGGVNKATITAAGAVKTDSSGVTTPISDANLELSQASTTSGQKGPLMQGAVSTTAPSYTSGQTNPFSLTPSGAVRMDAFSCSGCSTDGSTFTSGSSYASAIGGVFNDSITSLSAGQAGAARLTSSRAFHVNLRDGAGAQLFPSPFASANGIAAQTATFIHGGMFGWNGTTWSMFTLDGTGYLQINCKLGCGAPSDNTATGSLNALNANVSVGIVGTNAAAVQFASGTLAGSTVVAEVSTDGGTTWSAAVFTDPIAGLISTSLSNPTSAQYGILWPGGGVSHVRVRVSVFGSGAATANVRSTSNHNSVLVYGSDGTNIRQIAVTTGGLVKVDISGTAANGTAIKTDGSAVVQPVSGTVTGNQGTAAVNTSGWPVTGGIVTRSTGSWTSATSLNTSVSAAITGYNTVAVFLTQGSTITAGAVTFEASDDNTNWYPVLGCRMDTSVCQSVYTLVASTNAPFEIDIGGATNFRVRLSTAITGTGTVGVGINPQAMPSEPSTTVFQGTSPWSTSAAQNGPWTVDRTGITPVLANALSTTVVTVNASAAKFDAYFCWNPNSAVAYVQVFDVSGTVTLGTTAPKWSIAIPPTSSGNLSNMNLAYANAIKVAATTSATGSTAPTTALDCNFGYR